MPGPPLPGRPVLAGNGKKPLRPSLRSATSPVRGGFSRAEPARPEGLWHLSADSLFSYFLREESKQRSFQCLNQKAPAGRSHAYRSAGAFILLV